MEFNLIGTPLLYLDQYQHLRAFKYVMQSLVDELRGRSSVEDIIENRVHRQVPRDPDHTHADMCEMVFLSTNTSGKEGNEDEALLCITRTVAVECDAPCFIHNAESEQFGEESGNTFLPLPIALEQLLRLREEKHANTALAKELATKYSGLDITFAEMLQIVAEAAMLVNAQSFEVCLFGGSAKEQASHGEITLYFRLNKQYTEGWPAALVQSFWARLVLRTPEEFNH